MNKEEKKLIGKKLTIQEKKKLNIIHRRDYLRRNYSKQELINQVKRKIQIKSSMTKKEIINKIIEKENW